MIRTYEYKCRVCGEVVTERRDRVERNWPAHCPNGCEQLVNPKYRIYSLRVADRIYSKFTVVWKE